MKTIRFLLIVTALCLANFSIAQTLRGKIITPATPTTNPMDPNGDGFVTKTTSGFSPSGPDYLKEFELPMFGIPKVANGEVDGDNIGNSCGITDLIPDQNGFSVYAFRDANNNLICRFRVGDNNPSVEAWTLLLDVDGLFGPGKDPNATADNPGFELDITLIKRNNAGVLVYNIDGTDNCGATIASYPIATNFQISLGDEVSCGDPDYFYDFYVPFPAVAAAFNASSGRNISAATGLRYVAVTNVSATCAMDGKIADISGVDNDDPLYNNCDVCAFTAIIENQCPTAINDLCATCLGFNASLPAKPTIEEPIRAGQTVIKGTSPAGTFLLLSIYPRIGGTDLAPIWSTTPREEKIVAVPVSAWSITLSAPLLAYDKIVAKSQLTIDGSGCDSSNGNTTSTSVTVVEPNVAPVAQDQPVSVTEDTPKAITLVATDADNNPLTYTIVTPPAHGSLSGTGANVTYTPASNYFGSDSFTFRANDGVLNSNIATVTITVTPVNDAPVANGQILTTAEDTALPIVFTASDVENDPLTYEIVTNPSFGTLSVVAGAGVTYTPNANYFGPDSFTFRAKDNTLFSAPATISITVSQVPDAPIANDQTVTTNEDTPVSFTISGSDPDGAAVTYTDLSTPLNGALTGTAPNLIFTPTANFNGSTSFTFRVNDGTSFSNTATVTIIVNPINDVPIANNQPVTTPEDTPVLITLTASDVDGNPLTYTIVTPPTKGTLSVVSGAGVTYTPNANYVGPDNFTFTASDGTATSNVATVSITVNAVNDAPVANDISVTTLEDTSVGVTLVGTDTEGSTITYIIVSGPTNGSVTSGTGPNRNYTPALNFNGSDSFTYKVNDGTTDSNIATVTITVTAVNDAPVADGQVVTVIEDTPKLITLTGSDVEGSPLTFSVVVNPTNGILSGTGASRTYTPNPGYNGSDEFRFRVNDGTLNSPNVSVIINVTPVNDIPVANSQSVTTPEDTPLTIILTGSDADLDPITFSIVAGPTNGTLSGTGPNVIYTPAANYHGPDSFTFRTNDGTANSTTATVSITVTPVNDVPVAQNKTVSYDLNTPVNFTLDAVDADGNTLTYSTLTLPANGAITGNPAAPNLTYTPDTGFNLTNTMTFQVNDGTVNSNIATVTFVFNNAINDAPVAENQTITVIEDQSKNIVLGATDPDPGDVLSFIINNPSHGTLSGTAPNLVYTPNANYFGPDSFTYRVSDGTLQSGLATISITVTPVNDIPFAANQSLTTFDGEALNIILVGTDADGDPLTYTIVTPPVNASLTGTPPNVTFYTEVAGIYTFTFKVNDGISDSNIGTISINVAEDNDPPFANSRTVVTDEDTAVNFAVSGGDPHGDAITYILVSSPTHGTLSGTIPNLTYSPAANYFGPDSFTFKTSDGLFESTVATVSITVNPVDDAPFADNQSVTVVEDSFVDITLTGIDVDNDPLTFTILVGPTHGSVTVTGALVTYTPDANYTGQDSFTFKANDGTLDSTPAKVSITVTPANDTPIANSQTVATDEDKSVAIALTGTDPDLDALTYTIVANPQHGSLTGTAPNVTYLPAANYFGSDSFTFKVNDGTMDSNVATVSITVNPVNDPPVVTPITVSVNEDEPTSICFTVTDIENDPSVFSGGVSLDGHGTLVPDPTKGPFCFLYTPNPDYNGSDRVRVTVCDANDPNLCASGIITINVQPVNDKPVLVRSGVVVDKVTETTQEDTPVSFCVDATDIDNVNISLLGNPTNLSGGGTLVLNSSTANQFCFTFTPAPDFNGKAIWEISLCDDGSPSLCGIGKIEIDVTPVNDAPVANNQSETVVEDTPKVITLKGTDIDGDALTNTILTNPANGVLSAASGASITYTPALNFNGNDTFTYKVNDGKVDSNVGTVSITVTPVNDAPVISTIPILTTPEDTELQICLGVSDQEGNAITYGNPVNVSGGGTMTPSTLFNFCYVFKPAKDFNGNAFWKFTVCDNGTPSQCTEITVQVTVTPVNDAPVAVNDFITVQSYVISSPVNILSNDRDIENDNLVLTVTPVAGPFHGTVTMSADGNFIYQSALGYIGADSVRYKVCDTGTPSLCDEGVVFIDVTPAPFKIYNALSPNGDNQNDYWRIDGIEAFPNNRVRVFDRYNNMIFETKGYNNDDNSWRGQTNHSMINSASMPEGTYFYSVDLGDGSGLFSGYIVLKKN